MSTDSTNIVNTKQAIILFAHGSSNPTWREPFDAIAQMVRTQATDTRVELAFLEIMQPELHEVVRDCARQGIPYIRIVPLFFGVGKHVAEDLTQLIQTMQTQYTDLTIDVMPALGQSEMIRNAISSYALTDFSHKEDMP